MEYIAPLLLIVGGILAVSSLIVAKKPDAKAIIDKLVPFQALIGVAMIVSGVYVMLKTIGGIVALTKLIPLFGLSTVGLWACSIVLGFMFGMGQIAKWAPGHAAAEQKGLELQQKLAPYQVLIGLVGLASAVVFLGYVFKIIPTNF